MLKNLAAFLLSIYALFVLSLVPAKPQFGFFFRNPMLYAFEGHSISVLLSQRIGPPHVSDPPRITDLKYQSAVFGATLIQQSGQPWMPSWASTVDAQKRPGLVPVMLIMIGVNDWFYGIDTATFLATYATYLDARRAAGWYVMLMTDFCDQRSAAMAWLDTVAATERTWVGVHADVLIDIHSHYTQANCADVAYSFDGTHPQISVQDTITRTMIIPALTAYWP